MNFAWLPGAVRAANFNGLASTPLPGKRMTSRDPFHPDTSPLIDLSDLSDLSDPRRRTLLKAAAAGMEIGRAHV